MEKETDQISVRYHTNIREVSEAHSSMLMEDLYDNLVPRYGEENKKATCELVPDSSDMNDILVKLLPTLRTRYKNDLKGVVFDAIRYIAYHLVHYGFIVLEFITIKELNDNLSYHLTAVNGQEVKVLRKSISQLVPEDAAQQLNIREPIIIPKEKCYIIEFPKSLGGKKRYLKFLRDFKSFCKQNPTMRYINNPLKEQIGYDVSEHQIIFDIEMWKKSNLFSWHHRGNYDKLFSSYYYVYRRLKFSKPKIELRNFIIDELKKIIIDISEKLEKKVDLKIDGLLTMEQVDAKIKDWSTGKLLPGKFKEVI